MRSASLAVLAVERGADIVSDDAEDILRLLAAAGARSSVLDV